MSSKAVSAIAVRNGSYSVRALWMLMAFLATVIALVGARYFFRPPLPSASDEFGRHFARFFPMLLPHIVGGVVAMVIGPWQFVPRLRDRYLNLHRWLGRIYLIAVLIGSAAGLAMATVSMGGLATHTGFGMLAGLWFLTGAIAYRQIRRGDLMSHKQWMIRNYSLTFAAVTLRLWLPFLAGVLRIDSMDAYITVSWLCWVPNLIVGEIIATRVKAAA